MSDDHSRSGAPPHGHHGAAAHPKPWTRYLSLLRPERRDIYTIITYGIGSALLTLAVPLTVDALISNIMFGTMVTPLVVLVGVLIGCLVLQALLRALQFWVAELIERRIFVQVAGDLAWRLPRVQISAFDTIHGPELVNRFFDTITLQKTTTKLVLTGTDVVLGTVVGLAVLSFYHPFLLGVVGVMLVAIAVIVFVLGLGGVRSSIAESISKYQVAAWMQEMARHTTAFCTKGGADFATLHTDELCTTYVKARRRHFRILFRQVLGLLLLQILVSATVLGVGGWLVIDQQLTPGQLVASELIVTAVVANIAKMGDLLQQWYDVTASSDKIGHLIDLPLERQDGSPLPASSQGAAIELNGVSCGSGDALHAVDEFTLSLRPGERVALVGSTGGAASYLLDVLYGLREPLHGHMTVDGLDIRQLRLDTTRDDFALVHGTEIVEATLEENVRFGRTNLTAEQLRDVLVAVGLWDDVLRLPDGLRTTLTTRGAPLSGSQASQLMLARAMVGRPRLLMIDGALDMLAPAARSRAMASLFDRSQPWTVLLVTQRPEVVAACDRHIDLQRTAAAPAGGH
ncbi:MAG: ATP-binding cassette domain-containing protein [Planctomycetes bacterium]|jgi:ABC-type bacteriocin/lantibiotic exporter with double-glycine peptidase domain|nr:ATP-binding cassette domain-containing protein [Planctomycetota bacterium]